MATRSKAAPKAPDLLKHFVAPSPLPAGDFQANCKYCGKPYTGSVKATTNWWKHLVSITLVAHLN